MATLRSETSTKQLISIWMQTCTTPARRGIGQLDEVGQFSRFGSHLNGECGAPDTPASQPGFADQGGERRIIDGLNDRRVGPGSAIGQATCCIQQKARNDQNTYTSAQRSKVGQTVRGR